MSADTKPVMTEVAIVRCDICGGEIEPSQVADDPTAVGTLGIALERPVAVEDVAEKPLIPREGAPLSIFRQIRFRWPTPKRYKESADAAQKRHEEAKAAGFPDGYVSMYKGVEGLKWYDFHGECLANLVKAAVAMREKAQKAAEAPARKPTTKKVAS